MSDIRLRYAAFSDVGLVRSNNQDAGYASPHLIAVADGMGGAAAGDVASSVAISHLAEIDDSHAADDLLPLLRKAVNDAHEDMLERVAENPKLAGLGTTCIAILRSSNKLGMIHIGDSRAYLMRGGEMKQVTHDHTLVQYLVDHGQLTPEEAEHHPQRNVIMRALGDTPGEVELDESIREAQPGDRWLLCSDGLFGVVTLDTISHAMAMIEDLHELGEHLIDLALAAGAPDNVTVVLADVLEDTDGEHGPSQAVVVGSAAHDYRRPTRGGTSAAARAAKLTAGDNSANSANLATEDSANNKTSHKQRFGLAGLTAALAVLALLVAGCFFAYRWTQSRFYVGTDSGRVLIYRGIPQVIGSLHLSSPIEETGLLVEDLTPVAQDRLEQPITRGSLAEIRDVVENLKSQVVPDEPTSSPSETESSPSPAAPATPSANSAESSNSSEAGE